MVSLNIRIDESERSKLLQACETKGCSMSELAREAIRVYLSEEQEKVELDKSNRQSAGDNKPEYEVKVTSDGRVWQRLKSSNIWELQVRD